MNLSVASNLESALSLPTYQPHMSLFVVALHMLRYRFGTPTYQKGVVIQE